MPSKIDLGNGRSLDIGKQILSWTAHDYHPHKRGWIWMAIFCLIFFGGAGVAIWTDPDWGWVTAFAFFIAAAVFFLVHRQGQIDHEIHVFENCLTVDNHTLYTWDSFEGYWFVYDDTVSVINLEFSKKKGQKITLQMGSLIPEDFRSAFSRVGLEEMTDREESLLDLWSRALKL
jgi:hypothetical protein